MLGIFALKILMNRVKFLSNLQYLLLGNRSKALYQDNIISSK